MVGLRLVVSVGTSPRTLLRIRSRSTWFSSESTPFETERWKEVTNRLLLHPSETERVGKEITETVDAIRFWTKQRESDVSLRLFERVKDHSERMSLFNAILDSWRLSPSTNISSDEMIQIVLNGKGHINCRSFTILLTKLMNEKQADAPQQGKEMLYFMFENNIRTDFVFWTALLKSSRDSVTLARNVWKEWHERLRDGTVDSEPTLESYNTWLDVLCRHQHMEEADDVLTSLVAEADTLSYKLVIWGWTRTENRSGLSRAYQWIQNMENRSHAGWANLEPEADFYARIIFAAVRLKEWEWAERAFRDSQTLLPTSALQASLVGWWANTGQPERAQEILEAMEEPRYGQYKQVVYAWVESGSPERAEQVLLLIDSPDDRLVEKVLWSWSRQSTLECGYRAELLLRKTNISSLDAFQHVLMAWARSKSKEAAEHAELIIFEIPREKRNRIHHLAQLMIWAKVKGSRGLRGLRFWYQEARRHADVSIYGALFQGLMNNGRGDLAAHYWGSMERQGVVANEYLMNLVLTAFERSTDPRAPRQLEEFLKGCSLDPDARGSEIIQRTMRRSLHKRSK